MHMEQTDSRIKKNLTQDITRVLVIDDHTLFRNGVRLLLESQGDIEVVGEAQDGKSGIELYASLQPDVVLLDMYLPDVYGHDVAKSIKEQDDNAKIIVLSAFQSEDLLRDALNAGVLGYLLKKADNDMLIAAIRRARQGQYHLCPDTLAEVVAGFLQSGSSDQDLCLTQLTSREREIFNLVAQDLKNKAIAEKCFISVKTVEKHKSNIIRKLQLSGAAELRSFALTSRHRSNPGY